MLRDYYIIVGDIRTRYWQVGDEGAAIVLIHGFAAAVEYWKLNISELAKKHRVYALDMAGFGRSDKPDINYTGEFYAKFIKDFMSTQNLDKAIICGHSLGGAMALYFAIKHQDMVDKLILVSSGGFGRKIDIGLRLLATSIIGDFIMKFFSKKTLRMAMRRFAYNKSAVSDDLVDSLYPIFELPGTKRSMLSILRKHANIFGVKPKALQPIFDNLHTIHVPTLIIWGRQDPLLPVKYAYVAEQNLPSARLHILDHCGHIPQIEYPEKFNQLVEDFLNEYTEKLVS